MSESLISQRIRIPTRQKSQSISQIEHEQLRISFSILSVLQPQENPSTHSKQLKSLTTRQEQQFNKEYLPFPKNHHLTKNSLPSALKFIPTYQERVNRQNLYQGQYFEPTQILTPKLNSNHFHKRLGSSAKSSKKDLSTKKDHSKNCCKPREKSTKSIQSHKKHPKPFEFIKSPHKSPSNQDFNKIKTAYSPHQVHSQSKPNRGHKSKSVKMIVIIKHDQHQFKVQQKSKIQIQNQSNKENFTQKKLNILPKLQLGKSKSKSKHKKTSPFQINQCKSQKQIPQVSSDYWSCGFDVIQKVKSKPKQQKLFKNGGLRKLKQKPNPY